MGFLVRAPRVRRHRGLFQCAPDVRGSLARYTAKPRSGSLERPLGRRAFSALLTSLALPIAVGCTPLRPLDPIEDGGTLQDGSRPRIDGGQPPVDAGRVADGGVRSDAPSCNTVDLCDGRDDDCDPRTADGSGDDRVGTPCDGDDVDLCATGAWRCVEGALACDDDEEGTVESCEDGDEDCDGEFDEGEPVGSMTWWLDGDGDGYGTSDSAFTGCAAPDDGQVWSTRDGDCDDTLDSINPGVEERCGVVDDDCDGSVDEGDPCALGDCTTAVFASSTYQFCRRDEEWTTARAACTAVGYDLAIIETDVENEWIWMTADALDLASGSLAAGVYFGLQYSAGTDPPEATWVDESPLGAFAPWDPSTGEPNGTGACVRMRLGSGMWADGDCNDEHAFVCETATSTL